MVWWSALAHCAFCSHFLMPHTHPTLCYPSGPTSACPPSPQGQSGCFKPQSCGLHMSPFSYLHTCSSVHTFRLNHTVSLVAISWDPCSSHKSLELGSLSFLCGPAAVPMYQPACLNLGCWGLNCPKLAHPASSDVLGHVHAHCCLWASSLSQTQFSMHPVSQPRCASSVTTESTHPNTFFPAPHIAVQPAPRRLMAPAEVSTPA